MWYVCTVEYYSALKNDIKKFASKWKKPEKNYSEYSNPEPE